MGGSQSIHNQLLYNGYHLQPELTILRPVGRQDTRREGTRTLNKPFDGSMTAPLGLESFFVDVGQRLWWSCQKLIFWLSDSERQLFPLLIVLVIIVAIQQFISSSWMASARTFDGLLVVPEGRALLGHAATSCLPLLQLCLKSMMSGLKMWWWGGKQHMFNWALMMAITWGGIGT